MLPKLAQTTETTALPIKRVRPTPFAPGTPGRSVAGAGAVTSDSERDLIISWLGHRCHEIQQRVAQNQGRLKAVARCELATARAILREIECGEHVTHAGLPERNGKIA